MKMEAMFMQKLSDSKLLSTATRLLILLLVAKLISLVLWWYLPSEGVELNAKKSYKAKYQRVYFSNMLVFSKVSDVQAQKEASIYSIDSLILKGLYGSKSFGYAIVAKKASPKATTIVSVGELYEGYKLIEIDLDQVIFSKNSKEYALALEASGKLTPSDVMKRVANVEQESKAVSKTDIDYYSKNPKEIWKNIAISEVRKNGKIEGFKVNRITKGSKLATLGLEVGDVIIRANNVELTSYNDAIKLYKDIDNISVLELVVQRDNQEKEIIYEIH
jgi:type II secretion system protein C